MPPPPPYRTRTTIFPIYIRKTVESLFYLHVKYPPPPLSSSKKCSRATRAECIYDFISAKFYDSVHVHGESRKPTRTHDNSIRGRTFRNGFFTLNFGAFIVVFFLQLFLPLFTPFSPTTFVVPSLLRVLYIVIIITWPARNRLLLL